jgi:Do/DeqQ family serine protease
MASSPRVLLSAESWVPALRNWLVLLALVLLPALAQANPQPADRVVPQTRQQMQLSFSPVVKTVAPAVVNIYTSRTVQVQNPFMNDPLFGHFFRGFGLNSERTVNSLGSGVIIGADGLVVTSNHVIQGAQEVRVVLNDRRELDGKIILNDAKSDLALLRIQSPDNERFPYLKLRDSDTLEVGDLVLAVGNPFGVGQTVTSGIISALARTTVGVADYQFFIQTDAAINPGNSGGALVDMQGNLIGVNTAIYSTSGASNGIGFAIPANMVNTVMASAATGSTRVIRPWLGVTVQRVTSDIAESLGLQRPQGVLLAEVADASPAKQAGLMVGDVVTAVNGYEILDEQGLQFRTATSRIGDYAQFQILRKGQPMQTRVRMVAPPETPARDVRVLSGAHPLDGVTVANLSPALAMELDLNVMEKGVVVVDSSGNRLLRANDIIVQVGADEVKSTEQLQRLLAQDRQGLQIVFRRGGKLLRFMVR